MTSRKTVVRIGQIDYVNVLPFFHGLDERLRHQNAFDVQMVQGVPTQLNKLLENDELDVAPISSLAYARNWMNYELLPGLSVSSPGEVRSILLLHHQPLSTWKHVRIALTSSSETSVQLLKILISSLPNVTIEYVTCSPNVDQMLALNDAALLIGDDALELLIKPRLNMMITDLGQWWKKLEDRSMTYAVWAVNKRFSEREPQVVSILQKALKENCHAAFHDLTKIIQISQQQLGGDEQFWRDYFAGLDYNFDEKQREDLRWYLKRCYESGALLDIPHIGSDAEFVSLQVER